MQDDKRSATTAPATNDGYGTPTHQHDDASAPPFKDAAVTTPSFKDAAVTTPPCKDAAVATPATTEIDPADDPTFDPTQDSQPVEAFFASALQDDDHADDPALKDDHGDGPPPKDDHGDGPAPKDDHGDGPAPKDDHGDDSAPKDEAVAPKSNGKKEKTEREREIQRETSKAWHAKYASKGVLKTGPEPEKKSTSSSSAPPATLSKARDKFISEWIETCGMPKSNERFKAACSAWMASSVRADFLAGRAGVQN